MLSKSHIPFRYKDNIELEDAIHTAILTLKEGFEGQMTENNIEIGVIRESDKQFKVPLLIFLLLYEYSYILLLFFIYLFLFSLSLFISSPILIYLQILTPETVKDYLNMLN